MMPAKALLTAAVWWVVLIRLGGDPESIALASVIAALGGALAGGAWRGLVVAILLVAGHELVRSPLAFEPLRRALTDHASIASLRSVLAPWLAPALAGFVCGWAARQAAPSGPPAPFDAIPADASGRGAPSSVWARARVAHPDAALAWLVRRRQWDAAARFAEQLGMPRSAARWWSAAQAPQEAARVAAGLGSARAGSGTRTLELGDRMERTGPASDTASKLELENVRAARPRPRDEDPDS